MAAKKTLEKTAQAAALPETSSKPPEERSKAPALPTDNLALLEDMEVTIVLELGRHRLTLDEALDLGEHSLLELDKTVGQPIDVLVNGKLFARGEVVTVEEHFGVRLTEIVAQV